MTKKPAYALIYTKRICRTHRPHIDLTSTPHRPILMSPNILFSSINMPYKHKRDCPVCDKPGLRYMSDHLRQVHHSYGDERKKWLERARFSISRKHCSGSLPGRPAHTLKEMRCVCKTDFNFRHKFSLLVVGPTQSGKTYFVQQILEYNLIVYEEQKRIRIFWYYNQWQECYEELKKSLGKSIRFERGVPELSELN